MLTALPVYFTVSCCYCPSVIVTAQPPATQLRILSAACHKPSCTTALCINVLAYSPCSQRLNGPSSEATGSQVSANSKNNSNDSFL